jgi:hypothetical protein
MDLDDSEKAFDQWYNTEGWTAGGPEYDHARVVWMAACRWQGQAIAQAMIRGFQEAWFHPADVG